MWGFYLVPIAIAENLQKNTLETGREENLEILPGTDSYLEAEAGRPLMAGSR